MLGKRFLESTMKRDWAMIKCVLVQVEALEFTEELTYRYGSDENTDLLYHAKLLADAGNLVAVGREARAITISHLTLQGHDLLDRIRCPSAISPLDPPS